MKILKAALLIACAFFFASPIKGAIPEENGLHTPSLITALHDSIDPSMQQAFIETTTSLLALLKECDQQTRREILSSLKQTLNTSQQILKRQPRSLGPSRRFCSSLKELREAAQLAAMPRDKKKQRFWNSTPPYPAYPQTYYSYAEPIKLLIPFILIVAFLVMRNKACEWKLKGTDHADRHLGWAHQATAFAEKLSRLIIKATPLPGKDT
jgi:hypothetical protein